MGRTVFQLPKPDGRHVTIYSMDLTEIEGEGTRDRQRLWDTGNTTSLMLRLNVETIGDALIVLHYVAEVKEPGLYRMVSISDEINKNGRTKVKGGVEAQREENRRSDDRVHQSHPCLRAEANEMPSGCALFNLCYRNM